MSTPPLYYAFGAFRLEAAEKVLYESDRPVPLTPKAVETLLALVARHGRLVTKEELLRIVWPDPFVEENNLAQNISMLRRVLGEGGGGGRSSRRSRDADIGSWGRSRNSRGGSRRK